MSSALLDLVSHIAQHVRPLIGQSGNGPQVELDNLLAAAQAEVAAATPVAADPGTTSTTVTGTTP